MKPLGELTNVGKSSSRTAKRLGHNKTKIEADTRLIQRN